MLNFSDNDAPFVPTLELRRPLEPAPSPGPDDSAPPAGFFPVQVFLDFAGKLVEVLRPFPLALVAVQRLARSFNRLPGLPEPA